MGHSHDHKHEQSSNIAVAFFLNLAFTIIEIIGGIVTNSIAIQSDALHDIGDTFSLGIAWYLQKLSHKGKNKNYTYGYKRFNTLGAIITGVVLAAGSIYILMETIPRFHNPEATDSIGMMGLAVFGVIINGAAVFKVRHGHSLNEKMISLHLLEDVLGWVVVLVGSIIMYFTKIEWIDPFLSLLIVSYILFNVIRNLLKAIKIILQATPDSLSVSAVKERLELIEGIEEVHHIHLWSLDGEYNLLSAHIVIPNQKSLAELLPLRKEINATMSEDLNIQHVTIEFENPEECLGGDDL